MELVSAAREYETREPDASLGGFVDRLSLLSEADEESGTRERARLADDDARRQGARVPDRRSSPAWKRDCSRTRARPRDEDEVEEERRLCYVCMTRARASG